jgi:hypothetical protein
MSKQGGGKSALETAMKQGSDGLSEKQLRGALDDAVSELAKAKNKVAQVTNLANVTKEQALNCGTSLMHTSETMGSLFLGSMAEGFFGEEKMKLGGVDMRAPTGLVMQGYGLYQILTGNDKAGQHWLAIGNGVTGSWLANVGQDAGKALAERRAAKGVAAPPAATPVPGMHGDYGTQLGGPMVYVPPVPETAGYGNFGYQQAQIQGPHGFFPAPGFAPAGFLPAPGMASGAQQPATAGAYPDQSVAGPVREIMHTPEAGVAPHPQVMLTPERKPAPKAQPGPGEKTKVAGGQSEVAGPNMRRVRPLSRVPRARAPEAALEE